MGLGTRSKTIIDQHSYFANDRLLFFVFHSVPVTSVIHIHNCILCTINEKLKETLHQINSLQFSWAGFQPR